MADTTIDLLKNSSYVGKMDELIAAVKSGGGATSDVEWDNVKNKPTTIGGYGITDAKIENGTITLGNQTITPLTSAPVTSVNSKTGAVTLSAADVSAIPSTLTGTAGQVLTKTADGQEWKDVDIPTALPNPNALTFTGAVTGSYDGSEALTVEIPAGGGGSGAVGNLKLELIASGTMDADARGITVNLDNDGNPFELSIAALRVTNILRGADMTINVGSDINFGSYWMPSCITATTKSTNRDAVAVCTSFGIAYVAQGGGSNQSAASPKCYGAFLPTETIKTVSLKASGAAETLGAGLTYYLYGVRV